MFNVEVIKLCSSQRLLQQAYDKSECKGEAVGAANRLTVFGSGFVATPRKLGNTHDRDEE